ncbi:MAG TPA: hypothetical protein VLG40_03800 [Candidatus Saccharimonas sp.]|nr:hypothetical protein [Candidatus Saccharimonas sp.]
MNRPTVAIIYGLAEGPWCSTAFRAAVQRAGFDIVGDAANADYAVVHSGGHLLLPNNHYKAVLLVAPSCGNKYSHIVRDHITKLRRDNQLARKHHFAMRWWGGLVKNAWYSTNLRRAAQLYKLSRLPAGQTLPLCNADKSLVLICQDDPWSSGITAANAPQYAYATYQGGHDDIWYRPEPFAVLLRQLAGGRL